MSVLVVGGGLAGSAAAIGLARGGCEVTLVEREAKPQHKVCGEFLSREALHYLGLLGVDMQALRAIPVRRVRLAGRAEVALPFAAMSVTRRRLDEDLLRLAELAGAKVLRGCRVEAIARDGDGWSAEVGSTKLHANAVFLATGKHDLRGRPRPKGRQPNLVAFKMYWQLAPDQAAALDQTVELMLYRRGYAGLQPVEDGAANLCCLVERAELQQLGGWDGLLDAMQADCPLLRRRLQGAQPLLQKPLAISAIPYGYVREASRDRSRDAGLWALGDQAAVIPSFTGDGMSIALHSGSLAVGMYLRGETPESFQQQLHDELARQVNFATLISRGLVWKPSRKVMMAAARLWPGVLAMVANQTRIKAEAMG